MRVVIVYHVQINLKSPAHFRTGNTVCSTKAGNCYGPQTWRRLTKARVDAASYAANFLSRGVSLGSGVRRLNIGGVLTMKDGSMDLGMGREGKPAKEQVRDGGVME